MRHGVANDTYPFMIVCHYVDPCLQQRQSVNSVATFSLRSHNAGNQQFHLRRGQFRTSRLASRRWKASHARLLSPLCPFLLPEDLVANAL